MSSCIWWSKVCQRSCLLMRYQCGHKSFCKTFKLHIAKTNQPNWKGYLFITLNPAFYQFLLWLRFHWSGDTTTSWRFTGAPVIADKYWIVNFTLMDHVFEVIGFFPYWTSANKKLLHLPLKGHTHVSNHFTIRRVQMPFLIWFSQGHSSNPDCSLPQLKVFSVKIRLLILFIS